MTPEQVIANVMGYYPPISTTRKIYVKNTLRNDKKGTCWFEYKWGQLRLMDYGDQRYNKANYFDLVALKHFGSRTEHNPSIIPEVQAIIDQMGTVTKSAYREVSFDFKLEVKKKGLTQEIIDWADKFGITDEQLEEDGIEGVEWYQYNSRMEPKVFSRYYPNGLCMVLPKNGRHKVYRPYETVYDKWVTNTIRDDYYFWEWSPTLVITGSWKDGRTVFNKGYSVWAWQSETSFPSDHSISKFKKKFKDIVLLGDIDQGGRNNAKHIIETLGRMDIHVRDAVLPEKLLTKNIKDVAGLEEHYPEYSTALVHKIIKNAK